MASTDEFTWRDPTCTCGHPLTAHLLCPDVRCSLHVCVRCRARGTGYFAAHHAFKEDALMTAAKSAWDAARE